jgi:hypothetical protein
VGEEFKIIKKKLGESNAYQLVFQRRRAVHTIKRKFRAPPYPEDSEIFTVDANLTWLFQQISKTAPKIGITVGVGSGTPHVPPVPEGESKGEGGKGKLKRKKESETIPPAAEDFGPACSELRMDFRIDRRKDSCRTPARNEEVKAALKFLKKFYTWRDKVGRIFFFQDFNKSFFCPAL